MSVKESTPSDIGTPSGITGPSLGPIRVGVVLCGLPADETPAFKYFILLLNRLQTTFEFELYDAPEDDPLVKHLRAREAHDAKTLRDLLLGFAANLKLAADKVIEDNELIESWPSQIIAISLATLSDAHFLIRRRQVSLLTLGLWQREMAPPSAAEIVQLLVLRAAHSALQRGVWNEIHAGTRACLFDFTNNLEDTRFMALAGVGVCSACRQALVKDGFTSAPEELRQIVERSWLGDRDRAGTPAAIMARLGYDLYLTKGFSPTAKERAYQIIREEGVKELLKFLSAVVLAATLVLLGFKARETAKGAPPPAIHADSLRPRAQGAPKA